MVFITLWNEQKWKYDLFGLNHNFFLMSHFKSNDKRYWGSSKPKILSVINLFSSRNTYFLGMCGDSVKTEKLTQWAPTLMNTASVTTECSVYQHRTCLSIYVARHEFSSSFLTSAQLSFERENKNVDVELMTFFFQIPITTFCYSTGTWIFFVPYFPNPR